MIKEYNIPKDFRCIDHTCKECPIEFFILGDHGRCQVSVIPRLKGKKIYVCDENIEMIECSKTMNSVSNNEQRGIDE